MNPATSRVLQRWSWRRADSLAHRRSIALMKFMSAIARRLGAGAARNIYVVGGAVRDFVLDRPIKDVDVVIDSVALGRDSEWFADRLVRAIPARMSRKTNQYGVVLLEVLEEWELDGLEMKGEQIEIANARVESYTDGGYKPTDVAPATIQDDVRRRELTYNTLLISLLDLAKGPDKRDIIDLTGCGLRDLEEGRMQCPAPPNKVFSDDPSRMIRVIKFALRYGHKLTPDTKAAILRNAHKIRNIPSGHLITLLTDIILKESHWARALQWMQDLHLLEHVRAVAVEEQPFRAALLTHLKGHKLDMLFGLMDLGLPVGARVQFLEPAQQGRLREIASGMERDEAWAFLGKLKNPGNAVGDKRFFLDLAAQHGISGKGLGQFNREVYSPIGRKLLLQDPALASNPTRLRRFMEESIRRLMP